MVLFHRIATLILKSLKDELTPEEREELYAWVNDSPENAKLFSELSDEDSLRRALQEFYDSDENVWNKIVQGMEDIPSTPVRRMRPWRSVAAAAITILVAAGAFWWFNNSSNNHIATTPGPIAVRLEDISAPTGNNSTLTLGDGTVIVLDSSNNGTLAREGNMAVIKKEHVVEYAVTEFVAGKKTAVAANTLRTGRGGQQTLLLPDGSSVRLNAESSITYPAAFAGKERRVKITGEAYFEIKSLLLKDGGGKVPFIVEINSGSGERKGEVEVLGTHFNINAYDNEAAVKTTLLEGKVRMYNHVISHPQAATLRPGQQAQLSDGKLKVVRDADLDVAMAWTKNEFFFNGADLETILREASRWYPITVSFPHGVSGEKWHGTISRSVNLAELLKIFKYSDIHFKLEEGNKLIVMP